LLKRGYLMLIGGGVAVAVSLAVLGYYGMRLVEALEGDAKHAIQPGGSVEISQNLTSVGQGAYVISFSALGEVRPEVVITNPAGSVVVQKTLDQPIILEPFPVAQSGVFVLNLTNPSATASLEAAVILDSQEAVLSRAGALSPVVTTAFGFMLVGGIGALAGGAIITIMDRRRLSKMKQYGDTSDLV
jgi:hypothetical protein